MHFAVQALWSIPTWARPLLRGGIPLLVPTNPKPQSAPLPCKCRIAGPWTVSLCEERGQREGRSRTERRTIRIRHSERKARRGKVSGCANGMGKHREGLVLARPYIVERKDAKTGPDMLRFLMTWAGCGSLGNVNPTPVQHRFALTPQTVAAFLFPFGLPSTTKWVLGFPKSRPDRQIRSPNLPLAFPFGLLKKTTNIRRQSAFGLG